MLAWQQVNNFQSLGNKCPVLPIRENTASSQHNANSCVLEKTLQAVMTNPVILMLFICLTNQAAHLLIAG